MDGTLIAIGFGTAIVLFMAWEAHKWEVMEKRLNGLERVGVLVTKEHGDGAEMEPPKPRLSRRQLAVLIEKRASLMRS